MRRVFASLAVLAALTIAAPAFADHDGDRDDGRGGRASLPHGFKEGNKTGWHGHHTPPGWHKGGKTGWDGKSRPPGLRDR